MPGPPVWAAIPWLQRVCPPAVALPSTGSLLGAQWVSVAASANDFGPALNVAAESFTRAFVDAIPLRVSSDVAMSITEPDCADDVELTTAGELSAEAVPGILSVASSGGQAFALVESSARFSWVSAPLQIEEIKS